MRTLYKYFGVSVFLLCMVFARRVYADDGSGEALPVIARWENGNGYTEDGAMILDSWAYDSVNPAGKYVLFDVNGVVLRKAEHLGEQGQTEQNFTSTNQVMGSLAMRAEIFDEFTGKITIVLEETSAGKSTYELNVENYYGINVPISNGSYIVIEAIAEDGKNYYKVKYPKESFDVEGDEFSLLKFYVKNKVVEMAEVIETAEIEVKEETAETVEIIADSDQKNDMHLEEDLTGQQPEGKEDLGQLMAEKKTETPFKGIAIFCILSGVIMVTVLIRKRISQRNKRYD